MLAAVREFFKHAVAVRLVDKAVLDALFDLVEEHDLPAEVRGDRPGLRLRSRPRHKLSGRRLTLVAAEPATSDGDRAERVRALLRPGFLAEVWRADGQVFAPPREHPLLGLRKCAAIDCEAGVRTPNTDLCKLCVESSRPAACL